MLDAIYFLMVLDDYNLAYNTFFKEWNDLRNIFGFSKISSNCCRTDMVCKYSNGEDANCV